MRVGLLLLAVALLQLCGCHHLCSKTTFEPCRGLTIVLPGIEGESFINKNISRGLRNGQVPGEIEIVDWTTGNPFRSLEHLRDKQRVSDQAFRLARQINQFRSVAPATPVSIVAHSGGCGVALESLRLIPHDQQLASVVLIAPAVSRGYAIESVAEKPKFGIWSFNSPFDVQLTAGTKLFGTVDRCHEASAGSYGFYSQSPRLHQFPYRLEMLRDGHHGGHLGGTNPVFVENWIAPIVRRAHSTSLRE